MYTFHAKKIIYARDAPIWEFGYKYKNVKSKIKAFGRYLWLVSASNDKNSTYF